MMKIKKLTGFFDKLIGISFKDNIYPVCFETRFGIHTFFMRKPIDVFICDDMFFVKKIERNLKPWRIFFWNPIYKNVFEFPIGFKTSGNIKIGDKLKTDFFSTSSTGH